MSKGSGPQELEPRPPWAKSTCSTGAPPADQFVLVGGGGEGFVAIIVDVEAEGLAVHAEEAEAVAIDIQKHRLAAAVLGAVFLGLDVGDVLVADQALEAAETAPSRRSG